MTKLQQCHDLISDILELPLGQGDLVEDKNGNQWKIKEVEDGLEFIFCYCRLEGIKEFFSEDLKLTSHCIPLPMVLEAMRIKLKFDLVTYHNDIETYLADWRIIKLLLQWQLRKDNKWLDLHDQSEEVCKFLIKILGK